MSGIIVVALALLAIGQVTADLPIHCLNSQVAGDWIFYKDAGGNTVIPSDPSSVNCGYPSPDKNRAHFDNPPKLVHSSSVKVVLDEPNIAIDEHGNRGTWTMIYDEGFEVTVGGVKYFAFSKYKPNKKSSLSSDRVSEYTSHCDRTMVGWYRPAAFDQRQSNWGCWRGKQLKPRNAWTKKTGTFADDPDAVPVVSPTSTTPTSTSFISQFRQVAKTIEPESELALSESPAELLSSSSSSRSSSGRRRRHPKRHRRQASHGHAHANGQAHRHSSHTVTEASEVDDSIMFEPNYAFVETINSDSSSTWQAKVHEEFVGKSMKHMLRLLGVHKYTKDGLEAGPGALPQPIIDLRPDSEKYAGLPEELDWTNYQGQNYDTEIRNQQSCGSCYALATISALEARFRVKSGNKLRPYFSSQDVVSCSFTNQGCEGGYPFLVAKHAEEFGLVDEKCHAYTARDSLCSAHCETQQRYYVTNVTYVGGFYGGCNEVAMMREIYQNGPIMVAFQAPPDLFYYTGGIYTGAAPKSEDMGVPGVNTWQQTNHAVVAVGWGVDRKTGTKYWKIKNTWGTKWGENGYFRIRRGTNECGIESMASKGDAIVPSWATLTPPPPATTINRQKQSNNYYYF